MAQASTPGSISAPLLAYYRALLGTLFRDRRYDRARLRRYRDAALQHVIAQAHARTALGARRIPGGPNTPLDQIPPITKAELMQDFDASTVAGTPKRPEIERWLSDPTQNPGRYAPITSSGTTGEVGIFVMSRRDLSRTTGALLARVLRDRLIPREVLRFAFGRRYRMAVCGAGGPYITDLIGQSRPRLASAFVDTHSLDSTRPLETVACELNRFRPHYLHGYVSFLDVLATQRLRGQLYIEPEFISAGSEPLTRLARRRLAAAFPHAQVVETYGASECPVIANQCSAGRLHINEDLALIEPVDREGRPVPHGVRSDKLLLTNLINVTQPLIRYELCDAVTLIDDPCPCGSPMLSVHIEGRTDDTITLENGLGEPSQHPPVPIEAALLKVHGLERYQLQHGPQQNELRLRVVGDADTVPAGAKAAMDRYLEARDLLGAVRVTVERVPAIEADPKTRKLKQILNLCNENAKHEGPAPL